MSPIPEEVTLPPPKGKPGGLGEKAENVLERAFGLLLNSARETLVSILAGGVTMFLEVAEKALASRLAPTIDKALEAPDLPDDVRGFLSSIRSPTSQADAIGGMGFGAQMGMSAASGFLAPVSRTLNYWMDRSIHSARPDPGVAWATHWRGLVSRDDVLRALADLGWREEAAEAWASILQPRLGPADLWAYMFLSGKGSGDVEGELEKRGYDAGDIAAMGDLAKYRPAPPDLVRMAVREAWRDDVAERWGYDEDFPAQFGVEMERIGDKDNWSRKLWRAHWDLPGLSTILELFHRLDDFTAGDLETYLRVADIPKAYRDYILQVAYTPLTRVDVRRMYQSGVLNEEQVYRANLNIGYSPTDARDMTDWTIAEYGEEQKTLTKADIVNALKRGVFSAGDAQSALRQIGYSEGAADFYVARALYELAQAQVDEELKLLERRYKKFLIDAAQAREEMATLGLPARQVEINLELWEVQRAARDKRPGAAKLEAFYRDDVVDADTFRLEMGALGFTDDHVTWYVRALDQEKADAAAKEAERARTEQIRRDKDRKATDYQKAVARITVEIALQRLLVASSLQALNAALLDTEVLEIEDRLDQIKLEVASELTHIAGVRETRETALQTLNEKISAVERAAAYEQIEETQVEIARLATEIAGINEAIAQARAALVGVVGLEERTTIKQLIADLGVEKAAKQKEQTATRELELAARNALRMLITDAERQALERTIRESGLQIKAHQTRIAELREVREVLRVALSREIGSEERDTLRLAIETAKVAVRQLQVEKARLKVEER